MAHSDLDRLFEHLAKLAKDLLENVGAFLPFGAVIYQGGELQFVAASDGTEHPPSDLFIELLSTEFRSMADGRKIVASGICSDVVLHRDDQKSDAIQCRVEHANG